MLFFSDCFKITVLTKDKNPSRQSLIESAMESNLTINVENETFLVHKEILSSRNKVLEAVISSLPPVSPTSSLINLSEFKPSVFKSFLIFIYSGEVDKITKDLMCLAVKYVDVKLKKYCEDHLASTLSTANATEFLELAMKIKSEKLKEESAKFIIDRFKVIQEEAAYEKMKENPLAVGVILCEMSSSMDKLYDRLLSIQSMQI